METDSGLTSVMLHQLRSEFASALKDFASSSSVFRVLRTFPLNRHLSSSTPTPVKTLYVLDSSFNPPSKAHLAIARSAVQSDHRPGREPQRVLFLLATENADKAPKPAVFEDRLVMMCLLAQDLWASISSLSPSPAAVDIGVIKKPFFVDKAKAIDESGVYYCPLSASSAAAATESGLVEQVHLTGFDTLVRIFDQKYYSADQGGLRVLKPFLDRHRLRVTYRVGEEGKYGSLQQQQEFLARIKRGEREDEGVMREWADRVEMVSDNDDGSGGETRNVSSTLARKAVAEGKWDDLCQYVGDGVMAWIRELGLYQDRSGSK